MFIAKRSNRYCDLFSLDGSGRRHKVSTGYQSEPKQVKASTLLFIVAGLSAGCKPQTLNNEQLMVEQKLVEMAIDTLCHGLEAADVRSIQTRLSKDGAFTFLRPDTVEEAVGPEAIIRFLEDGRREGYVIEFGERRNLSIRVFPSGDVAAVSYDALANVTIRNNVTAVRFFFHYVMVRELGSWKLLQCSVASPGTIPVRDLPPH